jgi:cell division protein FtsZ
VITGIYFDEEVGDKMKITILAAGFNDSNTTSVPKQQPTSGKNSETPQVIEEDNTITIETMYSPAAVREMKRKSLQLAILTPEQMDNDALLEMFDNEPTYSRSTDFKQRFATASVARSVENAPTENNIKIINFDD